MTTPAIIPGDIAFPVATGAGLDDALDDALDGALDDARAGTLDEAAYDCVALMGTVVIVVGSEWHVLLRVTKPPFDITTAVAPSGNT